MRLTVFAGLYSYLTSIQENSDYLYKAAANYATKTNASPG